MIAILVTRRLDQRMYLTVLYILACVLNCVSSLTLNIEPKKVHVRPNETTTIMCKADVPISGCQFAWKNHLLQGPIMDFALGPASPINPVDIPGDISAYSYTGQGLENGDCGLNISISRWGSRIIGCRVRTSTGGWVYADLGIQVDSQPSFSLVAVPREVVVKEGDSVDFTCIANEPLKDCTISVPGVSLMRFNHGHQSEQTEKMRYFGTGLQDGQCGVTLLRATNDINGRLICAAKPTSERRAYELSTITVIVAKPPSSVELQLEKNPIPDGEQLQASCTVRNSRPDPKITWYLGTEKIRQDDADDSPPGNDWAWKNLTRTITQTIKRPVSSDDNGKQLRCEAEHVALENRLAQSRVLAVEARPTCRPLNMASLEISCVFGGKKHNCSEPSNPGTIANFNCKLGYILGGPHPGYSDVTCRGNGRWSNTIYECVLDCGKRNVKGGDTLISHGETAQVGEFPWHVAIYQVKEVSLAIVHICGGTLISPKLVVSAAHCFWNDQEGHANDASRYKIAAGKHHREWDAPEKVPPQKRNIEEIIVQERYRGRNSNFAVDIALLRISSPVTITSYVNVICVDWENEREPHILYDGNNGTVPGWGFTETGAQSDELKVVNLPYISFRICYQALPVQTRALLTTEKFCAGYVNRSISVCRGDSGGGLAFIDEKSDRYFIRGIVSVAFRPFENRDLCFSQLYTAFTAFSNYLSWVKKYNH